MGHFSSDYQVTQVAHLPCGLKQVPNGANSRATNPLRKQTDKNRGYFTSSREKLVVALLVCCSRLLRDKLLVLFQRPWGKKKGHHFQAGILLRRVFLCLAKKR